MSKAIEIIKKFKYPLLVVLVGVVLMLIPTGAVKTESAAMSEEELRLKTVLEETRGVGSASVLLGENGAVIVCEGADSAEVRLSIINAVSSYTGLKSDRILILKSSE